MLYHSPLFVSDYFSRYLINRLSEQLENPLLRLSIILVYEICIKHKTFVLGVMKLLDMCYKIIGRISYYTLMFSKREATIPLSKFHLSNHEYVLL